MSDKATKLQAGVCELALTRPSFTILLVSKKRGWRWLHAALYLRYRRVNSLTSRVSSAILRFSSSGPSRLPSRLGVSTRMACSDASIHPLVDTSQCVYKGHHPDSFILSKRQWPELTDYVPD
jgi:hypothetical protein